MKIVANASLSIGEKALGDMPIISQITVNNPRDLHTSVSLNNNKVQGTHREVLDLFANTGAVNATIVSNFTCRHRKVTQLLRVAKAANLGDWRTYSWLELN